MYKVEFKSKPMGCISRPPRFGIIETYDVDNVMISRQVIGLEEFACPQCGKPWKEHEGYVERPQQLGV